MEESPFNFNNTVPSNIKITTMTRQLEIDPGYCEGTVFLVAQTVRFCAHFLHFK